ncbi:hypothetical protein B0H16DRAFT_1450191 [Mycena metata]|uniref:Uncharacterized protein n=1 Tax=Mycena metata TaxID=1033252 RepID=A0AAD7NUT4_9AGAR|nr:hypothetical protein B0H16DRAFT_1450191 [Mycena metata]
MGIHNLLSFITKRQVTKSNNRHNRRPHHPHKSTPKQRRRSPARLVRARAVTPASSRAGGGRAGREGREDGKGSVDDGAKRADESGKKEAGRTGKTLTRTTVSRIRSEGGLGLGGLTLGREAGAGLRLEVGVGAHAERGPGRDAQETAGSGGGSGLDAAAGTDAEAAGASGAGARGVGAEAVAEAVADGEAEPEEEAWKRRNRRVWAPWPLFRIGCWNADVVPGARLHSARN